MMYIIAERNTKAWIQLFFLFHELQRNENVCHILIWIKASVFNGLYCMHQHFQSKQDRWG